MSNPDYGAKYENIKKDVQETIDLMEFYLNLEIKDDQSRVRNLKRLNISTLTKKLAAKYSQSEKIDKKEIIRFISRVILD